MEEFTKIIKKLFREKINIVIVLLVTILAVNIFEFKYNSDNYIKINKKVDFRYFNLNRSLEDIHNIEINTLNGEIKNTKH